MISLNCQRKVTFIGKLTLVKILLWYPQLPQGCSQKHSRWNREQPLAQPYILGKSVGLGGRGASVASGVFRPWDKGGVGKGSHPHPWLRGTQSPLQNFFWHFGPQFGPKIRGAPRLDPPLGLLSIMAYRVYQKAFPKSQLIHIRDGQVTAGK